jgi:hypothetical protein
LGLTALAGAVALMLLLSGGNKSLITGEAPKGGRSLQMPGSPREVERILSSWSEHKQMPHAKAQIQRDFAFIPFYVGLLVFVCLALRKKLAQINAPRCRRFAVPAMIAVVLAGAFDVLENFGMLRFIDIFENQGSSTPVLVKLVYASALSKWILLGLCLLAIAALVVCYFASRLRSSSR